jgi:hypothetical protein
LRGTGIALDGQAVIVGDVSGCFSGSPSERILFFVTGAVFVLTKTVQILIFCFSTEKHDVTTVTFVYNERKMIQGAL